MSEYKKGILTIAYGSSKYLQMGRAMAQSVRHYDKQIELAVVTDAPKYFGDAFDQIIPIDLNWGSGVSQKLHLDLYSPFDETIFIDSDCLFYGPASPLWEFFGREKSFGVRSVGELTRGDSCQGVENFDRYLDRFDLEVLPNLKGGAYYFDQSNEAARVFEKAREIYEERDEVGLTSFKNGEVADEVVFATALELCGVEPLAFDNENTPVNTFLGPTDPIEINVLEGKSRYIKRGYSTSPIVIHYGLGTQNGYCYLRDINRLELEGRYAVEWRARTRAVWEYLWYWGTQKWGNTRSRFQEMGLIGVLPGRILRMLGIGSLKPL